MGIAFPANRVSVAGEMTTLSPFSDQPTEVWARLPSLSTRNTYHRKRRSLDRNHHPRWHVRPRLRRYFVQYRSLVPILGGPGCAAQRNAAVTRTDTIKGRATTPINLPHRPCADTEARHHVPEGSQRLAPAGIRSGREGVCRLAPLLFQPAPGSSLERRPMHRGALHRPEAGFGRRLRLDPSTRCTSLRKAPSRWR